MAKSFKIASKPTFKADVSIPRIGADDMVVSFEFVTRPRSELAKLFDKWQDAANEISKKEIKTFEELTESDIENQVVQLKDIVVGWGFDEEFNDENIRELVETSNSVADAVIEAYNKAYQKARSGN